jgi:hypothetical protein
MEGQIISLFEDSSKVKWNVIFWSNKLSIKLLSNWMVLEELIINLLVMKFYAFKEPKCLLTCSHKSAIGDYPDTDKNKS